MRAQPHTRIVIGGCLVGTLALGAIVPVAVAQEEAARTSVRIEPVGANGLKGFAILTALADGTSVQVSVQDPPADTSAAIHRGPCADLDVDPVALLGLIPDRALITTTLAAPFATLADGGHALVVHPGMDFATVLGCGTIPAVATVAPTDAPGSPATVERYDGARYPFAISWSAPWTRQDHAGSDTVEALKLSDGTNTVFLEAFDQVGGDALACRDDWEDRLNQAVRERQIQSLAPANDADGNPIWDGDTERARGGYTWARPDKPDQVWAELIDCRRLSDTAVLLISHVALADAYLAGVPAVDRLLAGLELTGVVATPTGAPATPAPLVTPEPAPTPEPTPEPTPAPVVTPEPAPTPDCTGMQPWVDRATARVERLGDVGRRVERSRGVREVYIQELRAALPELDAIRREQAADQPPASLAPIQRLLDDLYGTTIEAYGILADGFQYGDQSLLGQADAKGRAIEEIGKQIRTDAQKILTPCGIRLPA